MTELAIKKLRKEYKEGKYDKYAAAMKKDVLQAMEEFCRQDGEFAQAVYQGGSFAECMAAVAKNCHGKTGKISLSFYPERSLFKEVWCK